MNAAIKEVDNVIDISAMINKNVGKKKDRCSSRIISEEEFYKEIHSADAITDDNVISDIIIELYSRKDFDTMIFFIVGINIGYRPVDILAWRWNQIIDSNGNVLKSFAMPEHKTGKTAIVNLNNTVIQALTWYHQWKMANERLFSDDNFVFTNVKNRRKSYVWYEKSMDRFWHTDSKYKSKGLMYSYENGSIIVCDERSVLEDTSEKYVKLQKAIDLDTISRHFIEVAKKLGVNLHLSSYTIRQTFSYWFRRTLKEDDTLTDVADEYFSTFLLSSYFQHSNLRITQKHYMRDQQKVFSQVVGKMNLGKAALEMIIADNDEIFQMVL